MLRWSVLLLLAGCTASPGPGTDTATLTVQQRCFPGLGDPSKGWPDYDQFHPTLGPSCAGTHEQDVRGVQRLVFLGDSVTAGTPPTDPDYYYRAILARRLDKVFGPLDVQSCAKWGAEDSDLLYGDQQLQACFPAPSDETTLVVMTDGGNDMFSIAQDLRDGVIDQEQAIAQAQAAASDLDEALSWFDDRTDLFPNGVYVAFANIYEYTDGTGDLGSCPSAHILGYDGVVPEMRPAYIAADETYMQLAVQHHRDMIFLLEHFCGHGFYAGDPTNECYRGPDAETWFDGTCLHPNPTGHEKIADLFEATVLDLPAANVN
jgi:lysophospholipase L1-like esterase